MAFLWEASADPFGPAVASGSVDSETVTYSGISSGTITCTALNQTSDRNAKENFTPVDAREVLNKVLALPVSRWNYKEDKTQQHLGPMAQDFRAAFGLGPNDTSIATVDADGVALAAIQDPDVRVLLLYLESFTDPERLAQWRRRSDQTLGLMQSEPK